MRRGGKRREEKDTKEGRDEIKCQGGKKEQGGKGQEIRKKG